MNTVDDTLLMSYVDGELDTATAREVESVLRLRPHLAQRVRRMREESAVIRAAFNHVLHRAPTRELPAAERSSGGGRRWHVPLAAAASALLLGCGVLLGNGLATRSPGPVDGFDAQARDAALQQVLEGHTSGSSLQWTGTEAGHGGRITPVSSYRSEEGRFCREFEESRAAAGGVVREAGVACRDESGHWRVRIRYYP